MMSLPEKKPVHFLYPSVQTVQGYRNTVLYRQIRYSWQADAEEGSMGF